MAAQLEPSEAWINDWLLGVEPEYSEWTAHELLWEAVEIGEGPMIFGGDEAWQGELDATCRRLRRYLEAQI